MSVLMQAGHVAPVQPVDADDHAVKALFFVTGHSDPNLLPRLVSPFAKLGLVPHRVHASREDGDGSEVHVDLRVAGVQSNDAVRLEKMLRAVVGVRQVIAVMESA